MLFQLSDILSETFPCAGKTVYVSMIGRHDDSNRPILDVRWSGRPDRMTAADCAEFEARKHAALAKLRQRLAERISLQEAST